MQGAPLFFGINDSKLGAIMKVSVLVFVCALSTPIEECDRTTALDVFKPPQQADGFGQCGFGGQAHVASTAIDVAQDMYLKVICTYGGGAGG